MLEKIYYSQSCDRDYLWAGIARRVKHLSLNKWYSIPQWVRAGKLGFLWWSSRLYCILKKKMLQNSLKNRNHYRKLGVFRVLESLPCALSRAHGKEHICRVPRKGHTANLTAHGKGLVLRVPRRRHTAKQWTHDSAGCLPYAMIYNTRQKKTHGKMSSLPCATKDTRQNVVFAVCLFLAHDKFV